ncbi:PGF-pre-PGF domain-containing protein, partial [Candidatus Peregrinibacteria bacterium]|nr:PGF-pre-PGF domain-containing protein [Candidatus Peregrinibacteria bacterium]
MKFKSRRLKKQNLFSIFLTTGIVFMLLFSGPVAGIQVGVTNISDSTPNESTNVTFQVYADITYDNERVGLTSLTLNLSNTGGLSNYSCTFDALAHNLTACTNVTILMINNGSTGYDYGYQWGYGYGYLYSNASIGTYNTTFGYGYGYGYQSGYSYDSATGAELLYNITWLTPAVTSNTNYTITVSAETSNNGTQVRYLNTSSTLLEVQNVASSESTSPGSSGGGGSGGGGTTTDEVTEYKESKAWNKISAGSETVMTITNENIGIRKVLFTLSRDVSDVTMDVIAYSDRPTKIPAFTGGTIFQYLEIVTNLLDTDVTSATIEFRVTKAWLSLNNIGYDDVALY